MNSEYNFDESSQSICIGFNKPPLAAKRSVGVTAGRVCDQRSHLQLETTRHLQKLT